MIKIGLDLAYRSCGVAVITPDKLLYSSRDLSKEKSHCSVIVSHMADWVLGEIQPYLHLPHALVMEDIFKGKWDNLKQMARAQGAVMDRYVLKTGQSPELVSAINARNRVNLPPQAPKVAIQLWALATFKLDKLKSQLDKEYLAKLNETIARYYTLVNSHKKGDAKRIKLLAKELGKQTLKVAELTGLDNHMADATLLALIAGA